MWLQVEGAFMQGVGHVMTEEVVEDDQSGALVTNNTWTYKPPGLAELPQVRHATAAAAAAAAVAGCRHLKASGPRLVHTQQCLDSNCPNLDGKAGYNLQKTP